MARWLETLRPRVPFMMSLYRFHGVATPLSSSISIAMGHYWHGATPTRSGANSNNPRNRSFHYTSKRAAWIYPCMTCGV
ncbi:Uncharacterized protein HZ326_30561 [Fusarium oxysporum f. sp. albedinis]|nr:Uncharacterized protein HZ326_30561 [Fusarium oxysporum f. sp. albedinis]